MKPAERGDAGDGEVAVKFEVDLRLFDAAFQKQFAEGASRFAPDEFAEIVWGDSEGFRRFLE